MVWHAKSDFFYFWNLSMQYPLNANSGTNIEVQSVLERLVNIYFAKFIVFVIHCGRKKFVWLYICVYFISENRSWSSPYIQSSNIYFFSQLRTFKKSFHSLAFCFVLKKSSFFSLSSRLFWNARLVPKVIFERYFIEQFRKSKNHI